MESAAARSEYVIGGGEEGKRRIEILSRILWATPFQFMPRVFQSWGARAG